MKCYQKIGFATQFYTLWDVREVPQYFTDAYGNHHLQRINMEYYYHKNISKDLDKAQELYPGVGVDENLRGQTRNFTITGAEKNLTPGILKFGKYSGYSLIDVVQKDFNYVLWLLENADAATRGICKILPEVLQYQLDQKIKKKHIIDNMPIAKNGVADITFTTNPNYNFGEEAGNPCFAGFELDQYRDKKYADATIGEGSRIMVIFDEVKYVGGKYPYYMGSIEGKIQKTKGKQFNLNLTIVATHTSEYGCLQVATINRL